MLDAIAGLPRNDMVPLPPEHAHSTTVARRARRESWVEAEYQVRGTHSNPGVRAWWPRPGVGGKDLDVWTYFEESR